MDGQYDLYPRDTPKAIVISITGFALSHDQTYVCALPNALCEVLDRAFKRTKSLNCSNILFVNVLAMTHISYDNHMSLLSQTQRFLASLCVRVQNCSCKYG